MTTTIDAMVSRILKRTVRTKFQKGILNFFMTHVLPREERDKYGRSFKILDINGDGALTKKELFTQFENFTQNSYSDDEKELIF
jgi:Ca2+-binding EF-hand superfamily protein